MLAIASLALSMLQAQAPRTYTARLGVPYLLGPRAVVSGSKEELDLGIRRLVALKSVKTAIAYGMEGRTFVAREGKKLVILHATIKNPAKSTIRLNDSQTFGLRVYDSGGKAADFNYLGASDESSKRLDEELAQGQSGDLVTVYEFPASSPHLRVGTYFHTYYPSDTPRYDLTKHVAKPTSVFAKDALNFVSAVQVSEGEWIDLDDLQFKLGPVERIEGGFQVRAEIRNPMMAPGRWGWQYAKAELAGEGFDPAGHYPDFYIAPEFADWAFEVKPGKSVVGHYRFYPSKPGSPKSVTLSMNSTKRSVRVDFRGD